MSVSNVVVRPGSATASYTAVHDKDGELLHAISDMRLFDEFHLPDEYRPGKVPLQQIIEEAAVVVIDANLPVSVVNRISTLCHSTKLFADSVSRSKCHKLAGALSAISLLKVNRAEAIALTGGRFSDDESLLKAIHNLGPAQVLMTCGDEGVVMSVGGEIFRADVLPGIEVVSTNGAGDAMLSGVIAAELAGLSFDKQLQCGVLAATETLRVYSACSDTLSRHLLHL